MVLKRQMDVLANNVANLSTPGFKGEDILFVEHLKRTDQRETLRFVQDIATLRNLSPGPLTHTGSPLDLAIRGTGYFTIETPRGERYTRAGGFALDADGRIVTAHGHALLDDGGAPLSVPTDAAEVTVAQDGTVSTDQGDIGRIGLVRFENPQAIQKLQHGLYEAAGQEPLPVEDPDIQQGKLEGSNVAGVVEMTRLIATVRSYQAASHLADQEHQRQRRAIDALAGVRT
jgi:flagellar basal-body rod protein FlgF